MVTIRGEGSKRIYGRVAQSHLRNIKLGSIPRRRAQTLRATTRPPSRTAAGG